MSTAFFGAARNGVFFILAAVGLPSGVNAEENPIPPMCNDSPDGANGAARANCNRPKDRETGSAAYLSASAARASSHASYASKYSSVFIGFSITL